MANLEGDVSKIVAVKHQLCEPHHTSFLMSVM